jgi:hypothetical protein
MMKESPRAEPMKTTTKWMGAPKLSLARETVRSLGVKTGLRVGPAQSSFSAHWCSGGPGDGATNF